MMPCTDRMRLAASPSLIDRISGMPPATAASKPNLTRRRRAAQELDHDLDVGVVEDPLRVGDQRQALEVQPFARAREVLVGDAVEEEPAAGALFELGAGGVQDLSDAAAHRAQGQQA